MATPAPPVTAAAANLTTTTASIYVGDLHPDVTDGVLFEAFTEFKSLTSVRVCRDSTTGRSLCYGYVNFMSTDDASRAIETKNFTALNGKRMRISWSCRDPDARRSGKANIFIKNLCDSVDNAGLHDMFKKFGNILSCKVVMSDDGISKGYGFAQFDSEEAANAAIEGLNGTEFRGKKIFVTKFVKKTDRILPSPDAKFTNLYVKNLDPEVKEEALQEKFSEFGKITSLVIAKNDDGTSRGFGFVNFENPENAKQATETMNGYQLGSKALYVGRAQKRAERNELLRRQFEEKRKERMIKYKDSNVYIKNIDDDVTDEELREHFSQCGTIISAKVMRDEKGISRGFGFVCFSSPEEASKAVSSFSGYMFHRKPLYLAIAQRKEDRQVQLHVHYAQQMAGLSGASPAVIPGGYPPFYYSTPGLIPQTPSRPRLMYQPIGLRPGWGTNGLAPSTTPGFQPSSIPVIPNTSRENRHGRGRVNGTGPHPPFYMSQMRQLNPTGASRDGNNHQRGRTARYVPNGRVRESHNGTGGISSMTDYSAATQGTEMLSSMLAAASPEQQKQILGERLYPLVQKQKPDLVAKITGMLLEMDNSELLVLLESPDSVASKVEEAVQVLKLSKTKSSSQESLHPGFLSAEVTVN
ncbi:hypothetical protein MLD38_016140 [Melastoma candidum]|uniref:Uncharacterized protein n=1 Tax=Melastoma candidum TaxID=119954 RepID=A0ACB9RLJ5_9MYRT|nr:hypothetical protein MLD38_016140 [Melastoma candidum]